MSNQNYRFWTMRQPNGCSTHALKSSAAKQWIKELAQTKEERVLCSDCCKKCGLICLDQVVFSHFVLHSNKIPLVLMTKVIHLRSLLFRRPDGVNCVVRRVYLGLSQNRVVKLVDYRC